MTTAETTGRDTSDAADPDLVAEVPKNTTEVLGAAIPRRTPHCGVRERPCTTFLPRMEARR